MEAVANFNFENRSQIAFWLDALEGEIPFNIQFPRLYRISLLPKGSIEEHWDSDVNS